MRGVYRGVCTRLARHIRVLRDAALTDIAAGDMTRTRDTFHSLRGVFSIHCVCHRLALIVTDAFKGTQVIAKVVPDECLELLNSVYNYFGKSIKRKKKLREFLERVNHPIRQQRLLVNRDRRRDPIVREVGNPDEELERILTALEEQHKLPRRIVMTRWLSSREAIKVLVTSRRTYQLFFAEETAPGGQVIYDLLHDHTICAWYNCLLDVLPVLTDMNVLFQSSLPLPHLLYPRISAAKNTLVNMVGEGGARSELMLVTLVDKDTKFGAFGNKYLVQEGWGFTDNETKNLKQAWHKLYAHCLSEIDVRFPPGNMEVFRLLQVLDPSVVHGPTRRHLIGSVTLASAASDLLSIFEIPIHLSLSRKFSVEEITNSFTAFRSSEACADIWKTTVARYGRDSFDHTVVYPYYRSLMGMPDVEPWAFTCLFLLIFPTGNAIAERGFSAMGATHTKTRSGISHEQVWANMMVQFNGPSLSVYAKRLDTESRVPNWWGHVARSNYNN